MDIPRRVVFLATTDGSSAALLKLLDTAFSVAIDQETTTHDVYYETFDWRLYRKQLVCIGTAEGLQLKAFDGTDRGSIDTALNQRMFWWELAPSPTRDLLKDVIDVRALLPLAEMINTSRTCRLCNDDEKTVVRLSLRTESPVAAGLRSLPELVAVDELRGYGTAFDTAVRLCREAGLTVMDEKRWLADRAFAAARRVPLDYGDKFIVELAPDIDVGGAIATICQQLLAELEINRDGVYEDIDSEFLHDFRIAIRRTRSLLSLLKKQFPSREHAHFRDEFKWLGGWTGTLRDIDVYLLEQNTYQAMLPATLRDGLDDFFHDLQRRRQREIKTVRRNLSSRRLARLLADWQHFISDADSPLFSEPATKQRCHVLADRIIRKRFAVFLKAGGRIDNTSPDSAVHQLRIEGKKLRYLLEFFKCLYPEAQMERFIRQLKKLQDHLGAFNDCSVQEQMLSTRLDGLSGKGRQVLRQAAAFGGLVTVLAGRRRQLREAFAVHYETFSAPENTALLTDLTGGGSRNHEAGPDSP